MSGDRGIGGGGGRGGSGGSGGRGNMADGLIRVRESHSIARLAHNARFHYDQALMLVRYTTNGAQ